MLSDAFYADRFWNTYYYILIINAFKSNGKQSYAGLLVIINIIILIEFDIIFVIVNHCDYDLCWLSVSLWLPVFILLLS